MEEKEKGWMTRAKQSLNAPVRCVGSDAGEAGTPGGRLESRRLWRLATKPKPGSLRGGEGGGHIPTLTLLAAELSHWAAI